MELKTKYETVKIFTKEYPEENAVKQIVQLSNSSLAENAHLRFMSDCLTDDTEVLTIEGWKLISKLNLEDKIANFDPNTELVFFSCPKNIISRELREGEKVYSFYNKQQNFEFNVSENHRMAVREKMGVLAKDVDSIKMEEIVFNAEGLLNSEIKYTNDELCFIAWIIGDGSIHITKNPKSMNYRIRFGIKKERKINRIIELSKKLNLVYNVDTTSKQTTIEINTESSKKFINIVTLDKQYPKDFYSLNKEQSLVLLEELIKVDGDYNSYKNNRGYRLNSSRKEDVDLFSALISLNYGYSKLTSRIHKGFNDRESLMYYVNAIKISKLRYSKSGTHNRIISRKEIDYKGKLVCLECDSSFFIARQKGITFVTGNCHAGAGCVIGTTMKITDKICPNLVGVDISCLDSKTEYLTKEGWKFINDYKIEDKILVYNKDTDEAFFEKPKCYIERSCDYFYHFKNSKGLDQMVSKEHKMLVFSGHKKRKYTANDMTPLELSSCKLEKGYYTFKTSFNLKQEEIKLSNDLIRFTVMLCADGNIREYKKYNLIRFHFKKKRKITRCKEILNSLHFEYKESFGKANDTYLEFKDVEKRYKKDMSIFWRASKEQLKIVKEESLLWDGHSGNRSYFCSTKKLFADIIQFAFTSCNERAGISNCNLESNNLYSVIPTKNNFVGYCLPNKVKSLDGKKYCFTTSTGYFVARRNGKIFVTGNCGVYLFRAGLDLSTEEQLNKLNEVIKRYVPTGQRVGNTISNRDLFEKMKCWDKLGDRTQHLAVLSCGSLGGGNHFIEAYSDGSFSIHTGSRNIGYRVAKYYQEVAIESRRKEQAERTKEIIDTYAPCDRHEAFKLMPKITGIVELSYLTGQDFKDYLYDMDILAEFADRNKMEIASNIINGMNDTDFRDKEHNIEVIKSVHNYIDTKNMILRKGAISAQKGEMLVIPMNMRDGLLLCKGKGNEDWNYSAPHGAGRLYSRSRAKAELSLEDFKNDMSDVFSKCIMNSTLDECPRAYKPMEDIVECIEPTVEILEVLKPIFNYKDH